ncbi:hypothetical protein PoB_003191400 [Plakobranchus ocellatus]|uniref:MSP domain-containing protein n=1 Tax=Plakobranchus ocellatus TaxID=259542 RepID=A0AAV4AG63_9GAST|nr:hypothetical protein PoB_003191400 [Plakobranchus ocellatus]
MVPRKTRSEGPGPYTSSGPSYCPRGLQNDTSLEHRRIKLAFNYVLKLKILPHNPCHDIVFEAPLSDFSADSKSELNLVASTFEHTKTAKINLKTIDNLHVQCPPP